MRQQPPQLSLHRTYLHVGWIPLETFLGSHKCLVPFPKVVKCIGFVAQKHSQVPGGSPMRKNKLVVGKTIFLQIRKITREGHHFGAGCYHHKGVSAGNVPLMPIRSDPCSPLESLGHLQGTNLSFLAPKSSAPIF